MAVRSENFSEVKESEKGNALDKVAVAVGVSRPTLDSSYRRGLVALKGRRRSGARD